MTPSSTPNTSLKYSEVSFSGVLGQYDGIFWLILGLRARTLAVSWVLKQAKPHAVGPRQPYHLVSGEGQPQREATS